MPTLSSRRYGVLGEEQFAAMNARHRPEEIVGMIEDIHARVGGISDSTRRLAIEAVLVNTRLTHDQRAFIEARLLQIVNTVGAHAVTREPFYPGGKVPPVTFGAFAELHDYCDANELGGLCDDEITGEANRLFPGRTDPDTLATQEWTEISNRIQMLADEWLLTDQDALQAGEWTGRTQLVGRYREAFRSFGELDIELPVGWWDLSSRDDGCPTFVCGYYRLWIERKESALHDSQGELPRFRLELLDENREHVCVIFSTDDWIEMQACIASLPPSRDYLAMERLSQSAFDGALAFSPNY